MPDNTFIADRFWVDDQQANERLADTFIMKADEVVLVSAVENGSVYYRPLPNGPQDRYPLDSPVWNRFRTLPPLGWLNVTVKGFVGAVYLRRKAIRSRQHGLSANNVNIFSFYGNNGILAADRITGMGSIYGCGLYRDPDQYSSFRETFEVLELDSSAALSAKFALYKDEGGLTWLYRKRRRIGFMADANTLFLLRSEKYYREDVEAHKNILPIEVREL